MKIGSIVVRCYEFDKMLKFWQQALHYMPREPAHDGWVVLRDPKGKGPNLSLQRVSERRSGKRGRVHLDLYANNTQAEVERLVSIGASRYPWRYKPGSDFVVLEDPDGNLPCVVQKADAGTTKTSSANPLPLTEGPCRADRQKCLTAVGFAGPNGQTGLKPF